MRNWCWLLMLGASCGTVDPDASFGPRGDCDPLDASLCALPWPSSFFMKEDPTTATGWRVDLGATSFPENIDGVQTQPDGWNERDGFSINSAMLLYVDDVDITGVVSHVDIAAYEDPDVKTIVLDLDTGKALPHWVELDATAPDPAETLLTLRPAVPMEWDHHYVVGIRGLKTNAGGDWAPSEAFAALRDDTRTRDEDIERRRKLYDEVLFPALADAGFARDDLQIAWDFHTASRDDTLGRLLHMRDDALGMLGDAGPEYAIDDVETYDCDTGGRDGIALDITGSVTVPYYTTEDKPGTFLTEGDDGMPFSPGTRSARFLLRVPCSVRFGPDGQGPVKAPVLQYGHGLLGGRDEAYTGWLGRFADDSGYLVLAMDWTGFASIDVPGISLTLALDPSTFAFISERSHQGMVEFLYGVRMATQSMLDEPELTFDGVNVVDPERRVFYGNSQGAIMGSAYVALSPDIDRAVFGVGGGPYSLLLPRSKDFLPFFRILMEKYADHRERMLFVLGMTQQLWDATEPGGWMWDMVRDADSPKQVLMQVAIYDNQVTTLGAQIQARAYGAKTLAPQTRPVWGVDEVEATESSPWMGSALVEWEYSDLPPEPVETVPPGEFPPEGFDEDRIDPHECPRREPAAQEQARHFLNTGEIIQTCDGRCVGEKRVTCP